MEPIYIKDLIKEGKLNTSLDGYTKPSLDIIKLGMFRNADIKYLLIPFGVIDVSFWLFGAERNDVLKNEAWHICTKQKEIRRLLNNEIKWGLKPGTLAGEININCHTWTLSWQAAGLCAKYEEAEKREKRKSIESYKEEVLRRVNLYLGESGGNK